VAIDAICGWFMMETRWWWRETLHEIEVQGMPHLALAPDLMTAIGAAPAYGRHSFHPA
jgi:hypothetical protein